MTDTSNYDHEALIDDSRLGNKPSESYLETVKHFDNALRNCIFVSRGFSGIPSPSSKHFYASVLFTALITRGVSLAHLMPFTPWADKKIEHWDYASIMGIARTMLELRVAFYYLCAEQCSEDEWNCRWNIFNLHDCVSRQRLFEGMKKQEEVEELKVQAEELRNRLRSNKYFVELKAGIQRNLLNGQKAYLFPLEDLSEKAGVQKDDFRWLYVLFSSHVHGLPMSFYRMGAGNEERGRGLPSPIEEHYTQMTLSLAITFLVNARDDMQVLFAEYKEHAKEVISRETAELEVPSPTSTGNPAIGIGETVALVKTDVLSLNVKRVSEVEIETAYTFNETGEVILRRSDSGDSGVTISQFDSIFWNVLVNNKAATNSIIDRLEKQNYAFRVDHHTRTLHFKVDPE